jgi:hypothetical protein
MFSTWSFGAARGITETLLAITAARDITYALVTFRHVHLAATARLPTMARLLAVTGFFTVTGAPSMTRCVLVLAAAARLGFMLLTAAVRALVLLALRAAAFALWARQRRLSECSHEAAGERHYHVSYLHIDPFNCE